MNIDKNKKYFLGIGQYTAFLLLFFLLAACAQVVRPTGGKTDTSPPKVLKYLPENNTLQFNGKGFSIQFDEFFTVKDVSKQWIISPPLKNTPEYKIKGKILNITFDDTLKQNTTYNFNFGKSIADVNEANELQGLSYIFSTGNYIDSLQLSGTVLQATNNAKEKDVLVMLYEESRCESDSFPYKITPDYFTLSNAGGSYKIDYIKPGKYRAVALKDANSNYLFDSFEELFGFSDTIINLNSNATLHIKLFKELEEKFYLKNKYNSEYGCFTLIFNKPLPNLSIIPLHQIKNNNWAIFETNKGKDSINIYLKDFSIDTLKLALTNNDISFDTVEFAVLPKEKYTNKGKKAKESKIFVKLNPINGAEKDLNKSIGIALNHPVEKIFHDSISLFHGKESIPIKLLKVDSIGKNFIIETKLINDSSYKLLILPGAFKDCFGFKNDTAQSSFKVPSIESVGNLYLNISFDSTSAIFDFDKNQLLLQLLNDKNEVINTQLIQKFGTVNYPNLKPGNYKAQVVVDGNKNGEWDTGKWLNKLQAEKIIFMGESINIRANWDVEEDWKISFKD
jgi:uncharacterized protein (DUF2141 family)